MAYVKEQLEKKNVYIFPYLWINFKKYSITSFQEERNLFQHFLNHNVLIIPGNEFKEEEPDWFRIVISYEDDQLEIIFCILHGGNAKLSLCS